MKIVGMSAAAFVALALIFSPSIAAVASKRPIKRAPPSAAAKLSPAEILVGNVMLNSVQPGADLYQACKKANFKSLANALYGVKDSVSPVKSEYETVAEYQARVDRLSAAINGTGEIIVCQPLADNEDAPFAYDADAGVFKGSFNSRFNVWRDVKHTGTYVSKTRMGARATVRASVDIEYDLALGDSLRTAQIGCLPTNYSGSTYAVPVARDDAPLLKLTGYLVFKGHLISPFVEASDTPGSPTLDDPNDVYERSTTLQFAPTSVAVVGAGGAKPFSCDIAHEDASTPIVRTVPRGAPGDWITPDDYPPGALRNTEQGITDYTVEVGPDGRVTDCKVTHSSGFPDLDETTCILIPRRARFSPAKGAAGNGIPATYSGSAHWKIP